MLLNKLLFPQGLALHNALEFAAFAAPLCIARQLEHIASPNSAKQTLYKKYRTSFEITMCLVLPCVFELASTFLCSAHKVPGLKSQPSLP